MSKLDATDLYVSPTLAGIVWTFGAAVVLLVSFNLELIRTSGLLADLLLGESRSPDLQAIADNAVIAVSSLTLENPLLNTVSFFVFWVFVGLVVAVCLKTLGQTVAKITETIGTTKYLNQRKDRQDTSVLFRLAVRSIGVCGLLVFYQLFAKFIVPFAVLTGQAWIGHFLSPMAWFYGLLGLVVTALSLHVFVIFTRLMVLSPRLVGGWDSLA